MANPGGYDYQRRYYQVCHKPLTVHSVEVKGNERTKAGLFAKVLEPVRRTCLSRRFSSHGVCSCAQPLHDRP
jgi:hypothetical protein